METETNLCPMTQGTFEDGTAFAAKVLSAESEQGINEFLTEIESITEAKHANLVRLLGCCVQRQKRILIYEYVENNSLDNALQGKRSPLNFHNYALSGATAYLQISCNI
jgi:hypothetical protein